MPPSLLISAAISAGTAAKASSDQRSASKRARRSADVASQEIRAATAQTPEEQARERETFALENRRRKELERRSRLSGEAILGETGQISRTALAKTQELVSDPSGGFESILAEELELVRQTVNQEANRRGVFGGVPEGGIRFEQLGRASIDLAVKSARERLAARNSAIDRALRVTGAGLTEQRGARGDIAGFLGDQQNLATRAREREIGGVERAVGARQDIEQTFLGQEIGGAQRLQETAGGFLGDILAEEFGKEKVPAQEPIDLLGQREQEAPTTKLGRATGRQFAGRNRRRGVREQDAILAG